MRFHGNSMLTIELDNEYNLFKNDSHLQLFHAEGTDGMLNYYILEVIGISLMKRYIQINSMILYFEEHVRDYFQVPFRGSLRDELLCKRFG